VTKHIVNISKEADISSVLSNLSLVGVITKTFGTSRVVEVDGVKEAIAAVVGVESCCCDSEVVVKLDVLTAGQWGLGAISNHLDQTEYLFDADGSATTAKILWAEIRNLDVPAPAYMEAVEFGSAHKRWESIHKTSVNINRIRLLAPAGVSGSVFVEGF